LRQHVFQRLLDDDKPRTLHNFAGETEEKPLQGAEASQVTTAAGGNASILLYNHLRRKKVSFPFRHS
jgi:hypothetical protein